MLVATARVRKASTSWPVGTSKVRMTESCDATMIQRESGEKACGGDSDEFSALSQVRGGGKPTHHIEDAPARSAQLSHDASRFDVDDSEDEVVTRHGQQTVIPLQQDGRHRAVDRQGRDELHGLEIEELREGVRGQGLAERKRYFRRIQRTWMAPFRVETTTLRFRASTAIPVTCRPRRSLMPAFGTLNVLRFMPDCMLKSWTSPACDPTKPKLPQAVTAETVALPSVANVYLPSRLFSTDHDRPSDSSFETETTSSHSRAREVE
jgi:hypothetical protein